MLRSSMRLLLLSLVATAVGVWWELGGRAAAQPWGCGSAVCSVAAVAPTYIVGTCAIGTSAANYGGSLEFATGNRNNCGVQTPIGQSAQLYQVAQGGGGDTLIAQVGPALAPANCLGSTCNAPQGVGLTPRTNGCPCLRGRQYYSVYTVGGYTGIDPNTCAPVAQWMPVSATSAVTSAP
jgi:hypothetical protein